MADTPPTATDALLDEAGSYSRLYPHAHSTRMIERLAEALIGALPCKHLRTKHNIQFTTWTCMDCGVEGTGGLDPITRAALSPSLGADDEALIQDFEDAVEAVSLEQPGDYAGTKEALRRRIAGLRAERDEYLTSRTHFRQVAGKWLEKSVASDARAEAAERELAEVKDVLRQVEHGAEYPDELGDLIDRALKTKEPANG